MDTMSMITCNNTLKLRPLLVEKCVILTGGRDKLNNILVQFPFDSQLDKLSIDDLQTVILYLASIPCFNKKSFVFLIDMRNRKYEDVKPILKIIQNLQENFNYQIYHVFIIKPDNFWQKQKTSFASSKYSFEHSLISMEQLQKYFDPSQLTPDLDGTLSYNNDQWIDFRIKLENFMIQSNDALSKFNSIQIELSTFDQPDTKEACQEAIIAHTNTKQRVLGINLEPLVNDGRNLLKILIGNDESLLLAPGGTRDSGYSGSESEKFNNDYFNEAHKIKEPMELLRLAKQKVHALWQQKKLKLEQCLQLRVFEQDCSQMMDWLSYNNKLVLMNYTDIGQSYASAYELLQKHEQFHKNCFSGAASIQHITSVANKLLASSHYASNLITLKTNKLEKEWQVFHSALQNRQKILSASCMFHNKADQYLNKVGEWKAMCSSNQLANSVQEAENSLKKHHELSDEISQIYAEVCNDGKAILDSIQSSQSTQIGQMEFKQAASHILDIVYEILSNHRQLELLWVNKKQKLQNRYRILNFQQNIKQVYNWLENHGEVFLRRNQSIGKNLMRAKMLHLSHENFVKVLKNTITNVEKLLASADDLVMNGEFEPQDVYSMTKELEQRMTQFLQRVEKRKNILDLSVLFHTHVVELDNWFNELKIQWTGLNLNDINLNSNNLDIVNNCIDNLEKHLDVLNEQKTVTSDAVEKTLNEGDGLLTYLNENSQDTKQSSYQHLEGIVQSIKLRHSDVDKLLANIKNKLELNLQIKQFEKDALEASQNLEHWAEELKYLDEEEHEDKTAESAESWLHSQIQTANQMQVLVFELLQRGSDLVQNLEKNESENFNNFGPAKQKIQSFIEYLNEREKELHELAIKQQRKLGQCLQINQLETECTQLLNYISNIEMTLFSLLKFARTLEDAEAVKKEHEIFKSNLDRVSASVNLLQSKSQRILMDKQQNKVITKFEQLMNNLNSKWQMLLIYIDNRTRLIMAQINFYKYTDQVTTVLESLELEYARDEDWYEKSKNEYDPEQFLQAQIQIHNQKKQSFLKACNWARRTGETFQKYSMRNICDAKMTNTTILQEIEKNTKKIMDDIHLREERTIKSWTNRKNSLDECFQYVIFEKSSKEALAWLAESEASYLNKFKNLANDKDEMKKFYKEFCEFTDRLKNQQGYVNLLIELSPKLLESSIRYGNNIAMWANKVETKYKEFFNVMSKVQLAYGLQVNNSIAGSESAKHIAEISNRVIMNQENVIDHKKQQEILKQNDQKQKLIKKRQNIITEILQTEKTYVQDLCSCLETYYKEFTQNTTGLPDYLQGKEAIIFGNLEEIYNFHKNTFLVELENYENMPEDIGHCFVIYADQFQVYVEYCKNKETSTKILMEDGQKENYFEKILRTGQLKCSIDSYLIKPIQRITKYQLLLKDLLSCCEDNRTETKDALEVMMNVPKKANDAIHLSLLEGLEEGLSKEALGDVLLQDKFQVWDSKQLIKKGKERHVFLFETSLVFAKEIKDQKSKLKYIYKFKLMTSEINITEHMEGDSCKLAVWTGRAPLSDHRVILKSASLDVKQVWVKKIRELIQEKYFYMEVAMCEAGQRSNRNSKDFDMDPEFSGLNLANINPNFGENFSSTASNASSGTKTSNEITTITCDYTTSENLNLTKGQHIQIIQRLNNDFSLVQLLDNVNNPQNKQIIEVQIPNSIIKSKQKYDESSLDDEAAAKAAAAKRKGSFKKWLRSSHRKFTNQSTSSKLNQSKLTNPELDNLKIKKVLSNSEDLKIKNWLIEETQNEEEQDDEIEHELNEQGVLDNSAFLASPNKLTSKSTSDEHTNQATSHDEDQDDLINSTIIPPPMIVLKQEQSEQNLTSSFSKTSNQSIDIQRELKLWQSKMENNKKTGDNCTNQVNNKLDTQESKPVIMTETKLTYAINELLNTERDYVNDLAILIEKYMDALKRNEIPMPQDMEGGKDKIVFGNIQQIYEWHKSTFSPELEKCLTEESSYIGKLFVKYENRFQMYVKYCENKPKSEYIVSEYDAYFDEVRIKLAQKLTIQDLLIKPVQRIMKYQLMLKEIKKYMEKEGKNCATIDRAIEIMVTVPKNADDMMNVGRLQGFEGRITAQGRLLLQDTLFVQEPDDPKQSKKSDKQTKLKERRVFLFQQIIIFSEMIGSNKKFTSPRYIFKCDMKVNKLQLQKDDSQMTFTLLDKTPESNRKIVCQCEDQAKYNYWINHLQDLLDMQNKFLRDLQHPQLAMQKSSMGSPGSSGAQSSNNHKDQHSITSTVNDFFKSTFGFASSGFQTRSSSSSSSASPNQSTVSPKPNFQTKNSPQTNDENLNKLNNDLSQQLSLDEKRNSQNSSTTIPSNAKVVNSYTAVTEDEITLAKGDIVQIITANMHNRFLVHREANEHQPAAEGWIPGHVIGFQSTNITN